jgi:hypothetical protein
MSGPVVFLVLSYHKLELLDRLVRRLLETDSAIVVVHHDARAAEVPELPQSDRAMLIPDPLPGGWGSMATVNATVESMRWVREAIPDYSWIVLVSGQDYPTMTPRGIEAELLASSADVFMRWEFIPPFATRRSTDWQRGMSHRYYWHYVPGTHRPVPVPRLRFYRDGVGVFAGSLWMNLSCRAVDRVLAERELRDYLGERRFSSTLVPEESFFPTVLMNSPIGLGIVNDQRRFLRFPKTGGSAHPETLTMRHLDSMRASNAFFARKVDEDASAELLDALDELTASA